MRTIRHSMVFGCTVLALSGCASVKIVKVTDNSTQPEGVPFYMPRPYVQVYEPFVVSSEVFLASGELTPDGMYLLIDTINNNKLRSLLASDTSQERQARVPAAKVRVARTTPEAVLTGGAQSGSAEGSVAGDDGGKASNNASDKGQGSNTQTSDATNNTPVGQLTKTVTQSTTPFPSTLGRRFFDVVWMPDFDEKYVVQGTPGLGNANIGITMVQGWGLYGLDAKIDNNALVKPLLDFYSTGLSALSQLAKGKILPADAITGGVQSGSVDSRVTSEIPARTRVSVKITKVSVAAPGLYPILKPTEVARQAEATVPDAAKGNLLVPQRPYTNIAFNVYDVLVIEAAKPTGDTPMNLQRYFDVDAQGNAIETPQPAKLGMPQKVDVDSLTKNVNSKLKDIKSDDDGYWMLSGLSMSPDGKLTGTAKLTGGKTKPSRLKDIQSLIDFVSLESKVASKSITLKEQAGGSE